MTCNPNNRRGVFPKRQGKRKAPQPIRPAAVPIDHTGFYPYLLEFLESLGVKGYSPRTIATRDQALRRFIRWCDERGLNEPRDITKPMVERYQKFLYYYRRANGQPLSHSAQRGWLTSVRNFFRWLARKNYILYNPASELELPRPPHNLPKVILSVEEVEHLLRTVDTNNPYGVRDRAILETFYSTGIRRMELANLSIYDVDANRQTLLVRHGKGRKDRLLPIGARALAWVERYRSEVRPLLAIGLDEGELFLTDYGEPLQKDRLTGLVRKYLYHAQIDKPGACHLFRHAMATHMLDNGADIRFIQMMLGHVQLNTTEIYTQVSIEKLRAVHTSTHPAKLEDRERLLAELAAEADDE